MYTMIIHNSNFSGYIRYFLGQEIQGFCYISLSLMDVKNCTLGFGSLESKN